MTEKGNREGVGGSPAGKTKVCRQEGIRVRVGIARMHHILLQGLHRVHLIATQVEPTLAFEAEFAMLLGTDLVDQCLTGRGRGRIVGDAALPQTTQAEASALFPCMAVPSASSG